MGGIGKTTLAKALAHDMREHFSDGVLWATLGQEAKPLSLLSGWIQALGDYQFNTSDIKAASAHLRGLLHDKSILLVVDDVWSSEQVEPFKVGSEGCCLLITTRRANVAYDLGTEPYQLNIMTWPEAIALLSNRLKRDLTIEEQSQAKLVAEAVGYLPLALELVAVRVMKGIPWNKLRDALKQEIANLETLEGLRSQNKLEACFNLSLEPLSDFQLQSISANSTIKNAKDAFIWFGVLPEDTEINASMASNLWHTTKIEASELLELMCDEALLIPIGQIQIENNIWSTYKLHDLLHDIARRKLINSPLKGLQQIHSDLLQRYCDRYLASQHAGWHALPYDGYIHNRLVWHLQKAHWLDEIHHLLCQVTVDNKNAWYVVREHLGQTAGYLEDVVLGWEIAKQLGTKQIEANQLATSIGLEVRYALITTSLNSVAQNIPPALLKTLVKERVGAIP